jgi:hypothetical protein
MKLIKLHQLVNPHDHPHLVSEIFLNKDIIRWAYLVENDTATLHYTKLLLIADNKPLEILETPDEINRLCNFIQEVSIVRRKLKPVPKP